MLSCEKCGIIIQTQAGMKTHIEIRHSGPEWMYCEECDARYWTALGLNKHNRLKHKAVTLEAPENPQTENWLPSKPGR